MAARYARFISLAVPLALLPVAVLLLLLAYYSTVYYNK